MTDLSKFRQRMRDNIAEKVAKERARETARAVKAQRAAAARVENERARELESAQQAGAEYLKRRAVHRAFTKRVRELLADPDFVQATCDAARFAWLVRYKLATDGDDT